MPNVGMHYSVRRLTRKTLSSASSSPYPPLGRRLCNGGPEIIDVGLVIGSGRGTKPTSEPSPGAM